jgi:nicotinamide-nucleotide amidase
VDAATVLELMVSRGATLATAESLTGGRLASRVTTIAGASRVYLGGVVSYASAVKQDLLDVPDAVVARHGVVSAECARAMAQGVRALLGADWAISTTGVAGPEEQEGKPPGTVFVGVAGPAGVSSLALELAGDRTEVQERTCDEAIGALGGILRGEEGGLR